MPPLLAAAALLTSAATKTGLKSRSLTRRIQLRWSFACAGPDWFPRYQRSQSDPGQQAEEQQEPEDAGVFRAFESVAKVHSEDRANGCCREEGRGQEVEAIAGHRHLVGRFGLVLGVAGDGIIQ